MWRQQRRARGFGADALRYDRARPSYPQAMVDDLMRAAGGAGAVPAAGAAATARPPLRVLDIGCGTAKAGRLFAARGCEVLGVEADERMAEVARTHGMAVEAAAFERWDPRGRRFDLAVCGQAWHWIEPAVGLERVAAVLTGGAPFAAFWNRATYDDRTTAALEAVYRRHAPGILDGSVVIGRVPDAHLSHDLRLGAAERWFHPPRAAEYTWRQRYDADGFRHLLQTHSDHRRLPPATLAVLLDEIGVVAADSGGITVHYRTRLLSVVRRAR